MDPKNKKLIALFLVFSLMMLSMNLYAKEKRGVKLKIKKKDGLRMRGELITVKPNSLLLLDAKGKDVSVDIEEIDIIITVKKSKVGPKVGAGFLVGVTVGVSIGVLAAELTDVELGSAAVYFGGILGFVGALGQVVFAPRTKMDEIIIIGGMTDLEIQETLDKLRKKARVRDYK